MKRWIMLLCLLTIAFGASAQGWRSKRKAKQAQLDSLPVMVTYKAASNEKFTLYFGGKKINEEPASEVGVKGVELNEPYNVRVVLKSPYVVANMNFRLTTLAKEGEMYVVYRNAKLGTVEIYTLDEYRKMIVEKGGKSVESLRPRAIDMDSLTLLKPVKDSVQEQQIEIIVLDEMGADSADVK